MAQDITYFLFTAREKEQRRIGESRVANLFWQMRERAEYQWRARFCVTVTVVELPGHHKTEADSRKKFTQVSRSMSMQL